MTLKKLTNLKNQTTWPINSFVVSLIALSLSRLQVLLYIAWGSKVEMDSVDSNGQRLFSEVQYGSYMIFMAFTVVAFSKFNEPMTKSVKAFKISATLFTINFFAAWFALQENTRGLVFYSYPLAFNLIFYTTMISAPGVLFCTSLHQQLIAKKNTLLV